MIRLNENETQALVELLQPEIIRNLNPNYSAILEELYNKLTNKTQRPSRLHIYLLAIFYWLIQWFVRIA